MGRLDSRRAISELHTSGRMEAFVDELFPAHATRVHKEWPHKETFEAIVAVEVRDIAHCILSNMASMLYEIPWKAIKLLAVIRSQRVAEVFNKCLAQGIFPTARRRERLKLQRKDQKPLEEPSSYRPLWMLDSTGKLFEKIVDMRLEKISEN